MTDIKVPSVAPNYIRPTRAEVVALSENEMQAAGLCWLNTNPPPEIAHFTVGFAEDLYTEICQQFADRGVDLPSGIDGHRLAHYVLAQCAYGVARANNYKFEL